MVAAGQGRRANTRGILCMLASVCIITLNDSLLKWLSADFPVGQIMAIRGLFVFLPVLALARWEGGLHMLRISRPGAQTMRAVFVVAGMFLYIGGLRFMPLADAIAITFAGPLFSTALAVPMLGEKVGWRRWSAVVIGLIGVTVMLRPSGEGIAWAAMLPLGAALTSGFRDIVTRRLSVSDSSSSILGVTTLAVTCAGFLTILIPPLTGWDYWTWQPMDLAHVAILALAGLLLGTGQYLMIESVRLAEIGLVAPFRYTSMLWAVALGYLVYGTLPDHWVLTGAGLVIASGIYILHRDTRVRAAPAAVGGRPDALPLHKDG
ncbi:MAG: DMT family transporter [Proteobacteria bacterium]|nr:DMT family transporter [Pseudomonadota bacterium]